MSTVCNASLLITTCFFPAEYIYYYAFLMILTINTEDVSYHHNWPVYVMRALRVSCDARNQFFITLFGQKLPYFSKTSKILLQNSAFHYSRTKQIFLARVSSHWFSYSKALIETVSVRRTSGTLCKRKDDLNSARSKVAFTFPELCLSFPLLLFLTILSLPLRSSQG
jgi:hypothetical protein